MDAILCIVSGSTCRSLSTLWFEFVVSLNVCACVRDDIKTSLTTPTLTYLETEHHISVPDHSDMTFKLTSSKLCHACVP